MAPSDSQGHHIISLGAARATQPFRIWAVTDRRCVARWLDTAIHPYRSRLNSEAHTLSGSQSKREHLGSGDSDVVFHVKEDRIR